MSERDDSLGLLSLCFTCFTFPNGTELERGFCRGVVIYSLLSS